MLPFQFKAIPLTLGLMSYSLLWLVSLGFARKLELIRTNQMTGFLFAYFLWIVIGGIYSGTGSEAERYLVLKIPFLAWAILLGSVDLFSARHKRLLIDAFIYSLLVAIVISFGNAIILYLPNSDGTHFFYSRLMIFKMVPPHYFAMYVNFAYGVVLYRFFTGKPMASHRLLTVLILIALFVTLVFLSVRIQYLVFVVINILILFSLKSRYSLRTRLLWTITVAVALAALAFTLPHSRKRVLDTVNEVNSFGGMVNDKQTNPRKFLWREGWNVVNDNFWVGTGTGAADQALQKELEDVDALFWDGSSTYFLRDRNFNYHNSYLQHWAAHGFIGLLILLTMLFYPFFKRGVPFEGKIFLGVCCLSFLTESILQRQAGVLFFSFFYTVFFIMHPLEKREEDIGTI